MYHHSVLNLSTVKSTFNYGYGFFSHVEAYWIEKKIVVNYFIFKWQAVFEDYICYGRTKDEAIEELLIALDDGSR